MIVDLFRVETGRWEARLVWCVREVLGLEAVAREPAISDRTLTDLASAQVPRRVEVHSRRGGRHVELPTGAVVDRGGCAAHRGRFAPQHPVAVETTLSVVEFVDGVADAARGPQVVGRVIDAADLSGRYQFGGLRECRSLS